LELKVMRNKFSLYVVISFFSSVLISFMFATPAFALGSNTFRLFSFLLENPMATMATIAIVGALVVLGVFASMLMRDS
jgi:hypothetical protein